MASVDLPAPACPSAPMLRLSVIPPPTLGCCWWWWYAADATSFLRGLYPASAEMPLLLSLDALEDVPAPRADLVLPLPDDRRRKPIRGGLLMPSPRCCWGPPPPAAPSPPLFANSDEPEGCWWSLGTKRSCCCCRSALLSIARLVAALAAAARERMRPDTPPTGDATWSPPSHWWCWLWAVVVPKEVFRGGEFSARRCWRPRPAYSRPTRASGEPPPAPSAGYWGKTHPR